MKLIDKEPLIAKIKSRIDTNETCQKISGGHEFYRGAIDEAKEILCYINTLEVKEVDLEKEFDSFAYTLPRSATGDGPFDKHFDDPTVIEAKNHGWRHKWSYEQALKIAKHFFKLGILVSNKA